MTYNYAALKKKQPVIVIHPDTIYTSTKEAITLPESPQNDSGSVIYFAAVRMIFPSVCQIPLGPSIALQSHRAVYRPRANVACTLVLRVGKTHTRPFPRALAVDSAALFQQQRCLQRQFHHLREGTLPILGR